MSYYAPMHYGELIIRQFWHAAIQFEDKNEMPHAGRYYSNHVLSVHNRANQYSLLKSCRPADKDRKLWNAETKSMHFIYSNQASANERQCTGWPALALYNERQCSPWPINSSVMKDCGLIDLQFCCNDRPAT